MNSSSPILINDLIMEILSRLPSKSVARFRCVSKPWASMLSSPYFKNLFSIRSSAKPRLLFAIENNGWNFFSLAMLENPYDQESNLVAAAEFHVNISPDIEPCDFIRHCSCAYASGLFYIHYCGFQGRPLIFNPVTGRYAILPYICREADSFFGFDPVDKQYKALFMDFSFSPSTNKSLTFGDGDIKYSKVTSSLRHDIASGGICINGVVYYFGDTTDCINDDHVVTPELVIVCFDVRSEKITFIEFEKIGELIDYKGKLALIYWGDDYAIKELHMWVLDDVEKKEWSKYAYTLTTDDKCFCRYVVGATASGDIVFSTKWCGPKELFYVYYFSPERNRLQRVEIKGFGEAASDNGFTVRTFVNHVEDLDVNDLKLLKSFHSPVPKLKYA
ncbi:F-box protein At2g16450-like [Capsella rubella]|uniref:F-box protein At2g16450-like n=1 Tax=Capsella rubella TaxID=81985 RepID=UPI000CD57415|nr:F-box protein At2g16450-like [Capsella rubella]